LPVDVLATAIDQAVPATDLELTVASDVATEVTGQIRRQHACHGGRAPGIRRHTKLAAFETASAGPPA
jgi:hypothetical protein